jgi:23S rRNA (adenine2503-C2)-methyltransferase
MYTENTSPIIENGKKYLFNYTGGSVEGCLLYLDYRKTPNVICISSQIGCTYSCSICANGILPFRRSLTAAELIDQTKRIKLNNKHLANQKFEITLMGVGEPLENLGEIVPFMEEAFSSFNNLVKINISTIGVISSLHKLIKLKLPFYNRMHIQISLHASSDEQRRKLLDNRLPAITETIMLSEEFSKQYNDTVCYNYLLLKGVNDSEKDLFDLYGLLKNKRAYVKLSNLNWIRNAIYTPSDHQVFVKAANLLNKLGIPTKIFRSVGSDIQIGCGQLISTK